MGQGGWGCPCEDHPSPQPGAGMQTRLLRAVGWSSAAVLGVLGVAVFLLVLTLAKDAALPTRSKVGARWVLGEPRNDHRPLPTSHPSISPAFLSACKSSRNQPSFAGLNLIKVALGGSTTLPKTTVQGTKEGREKSSPPPEAAPFSTPDTFSSLFSDIQSTWWVYISPTCCFLLAFADS